jgi:hypothetical protein
LYSFFTYEDISSRQLRDVYSGTDELYLYPGNPGTFYEYERFTIRFFSPHLYDEFDFRTDLPDEV